MAVPVAGGRSGSARRTPGRDQQPTGTVALSIGPGGIGEPGLVEHRCQAEERDGRYYRGVRNDRSLVVGEAPFTLSEMGYGGRRLVAGREVLDPAPVRIAWRPRRPGAGAAPTTGSDSTRH